MVRSTAKTLAGSAAAAAKKVISRSTAQPSPAPDKGTAKKAAAPAKKAAAAAKKAPAQKTPAQKQATAVKKSASRKAASSKAAPAKKTASPTRKAAPTSSKTAPATKSAPATATTPASLAVKEGEERWSKAELNEVLAELHEHRERLTALLKDQETDLANLMRDAGDGAGHDQADMGATSFERDQELTVVNNEREMLAQIERALGRIDDGTYGVCESCGNAIGKMRVMAFPRATLCLPCKQREERR